MIHSTYNTPKNPFTALLLKYPDFDRGLLKKQFKFHCQVGLGRGLSSAFEIIKLLILTSTIHCTVLNKVLTITLNQIRGATREVDSSF